MSEFLLQRHILHIRIDSVDLLISFTGDCLSLQEALISLNEKKNKYSLLMEVK